MVKILSSSGRSISDVYDVEGSIVGIDQLLARDGISLVHEMGETIFSERVSGAIRRITTGDLAQNTDWGIVITDLPSTPTRILGASMMADNAARVSFSTLSIRDPRDEREIPIRSWDTAETSIIILIQDDGAVVTTFDLLTTAAEGGAVPSMLFGVDQIAPVNQIAFRGRTLGFGAGTVEVVALIYVAFSQVGGLSSRGLPFPSW